MNETIAPAIAKLKPVIIGPAQGGTTPFCVTTCRAHVSESVIMIGDDEMSAGATITLLRWRSRLRDTACPVRLYANIWKGGALSKS